MTIKKKQIYIPVLPKSLLSYVCAPMPFVVGILRTELEEALSFPMEEALIIDIDKNEFIRTPYESDAHDLNLLPPNYSAQLRKALKNTKNVLKSNSLLPLLPFLPPPFSPPSFLPLPFPSFLSFSLLSFPLLHFSSFFLVRILISFLFLSPLCPLPFPLFPSSPPLALLPSPSCPSPCKEQRKDRKTNLDERMEKDLNYQMSVAKEELVTTFSQFFVIILGGYRNFISIPKKSFGRENFISSHPPDVQPVCPFPFPLLPPFSFSLLLSPRPLPFPPSLLLSPRPFPFPLSPRPLPSPPP